jgi:hypothetical protein
MPNFPAATVLRKDIAMSLPRVAASRLLNLVVLITPSPERDECLT